MGGGGGGGMSEPRALGGGMDSGAVVGADHGALAAPAARAADADGRGRRAEAQGEALEVGGAGGEPGRRRDVDEVVDAAVLLEDVDVVLHGDAVELGPHERVERLAVVEGERLLADEVARGGPHDEVLGQHGERGVRAATAADVEHGRALAALVAVGEVGPLDAHPVPLGGHGAYVDGQIALAEDAPSNELRARTPGRRRGALRGREGLGRGPCLSEGITPLC